MATSLEANPRGIPKAPFVDVVEKFLEGDQTADDLMNKFSELLRMFKRMQISVLAKEKSLASKLPELGKALESVRLFLAKQPLQEPLELHAELCDTLYTRATVTSVDRVCLWLGANVMIEYGLEEACSLLEQKAEQCQRSLQVVRDDAEYLREQITTMEVNIARVYNWDVKQRRAKTASVATA